MPRYDYECSGCGHVFELRQSFESEPYGDCPKCGSASRRKFHAVPIIYKGSGFYTTDYKHTNYSPVDKDDKDKDKSESSSDGKAKSEKGDNAKGTGEAAKAAAGNSSDD